jgi:hypothetical protein
MSRPPRGARGGCRRATESRPQRPSSEHELTTDPAKPNWNVAVKVVAHAHVTTYLVRGMDIVHGTEIDLRWEFVSSKVPPMQPPVIGARGARRLEAAQRARLVEQFPSNSLDYLP